MINMDKIREAVSNTLKEYDLEVQETKAPEDSELILLTHPMCSACKDLKETLKDAIEQGAIREVPVTGEEGKKIAEKLKIEEYPTLVLRVGKEFRKCIYKFEGEDFVFECDTEPPSPPQSTTSEKVSEKK